MTPEQKHYSNVHLWIRRNYGVATKCEFCPVQNKRFEWALKKGCDYEKDISLFMQLCPSCHRKYDYTEKQRNKIREISKNNHFSLNNPMKLTCNKKKASEWMQRRFISDSTRIKHSNSLKGIPPVCAGSGKRKCIDTSSGKVYESLKEASLNIGVKYSTLKNYFRPTRLNKSTIQWMQN